MLAQAGFCVSQLSGKSANFSQGEIFIWNVNMVVPVLMFLPLSLRY